MKRINITQAAAVIGVAGLLGVASIAIAGDQNSNKKSTAPTFTNPDSLPKFDHVKVVNATPEQLAAFASHKTPSVGMKAAVDPTSLQLRPLTAEDAAALAPAPEAQGAPSGPIAFTTSEGLHGVLLDESSMSYAVAQVGKDGKVRQACLDGQANDEAAMKAAAALKGVDKNEK